MTRNINFKPNKLINECPKCGNNTSFTIHSERAGEDYCNIWAVCKCGFDPTSSENLGSDYRVEDVWGGCDDNNCRDAIEYSWNEPIEELLIKSKI